VNYESLHSLDSCYNVICLDSESVEPSVSGTHMSALHDVPDSTPICQNSARMRPYTRQIVILSRQ